jgi:hypothetical protein
MVAQLPTMELWHVSDGQPELGEGKQYRVLAEGSTV